MKSITNTQDIIRLLRRFWTRQKIADRIEVTTMTIQRWEGGDLAKASYKEKFHDALHVAADRHWKRYPVVADFVRSFPVTVGHGRRRWNASLIKSLIEEQLPAEPGEVIKALAKSHGITEQVVRHHASKMGVRTNEDKEWHRPRVIDDANELVKELMEEYPITQLEEKFGVPAQTIHRWANSEAYCHEEHAPVFEKERLDVSLIDPMKGVPVL